MKHRRTILTALVVLLARQAACQSLANCQTQTGGTCTFVTPATSTTVDLVSTYGAVPSTSSAPGFDNSWAFFQCFLDMSLLAGTKVVTIPAGTYHVWPFQRPATLPAPYSAIPSPSPNKVCAYLWNVNNLSIVGLGAGAHIVCHDREAPVFGINASTPTASGYASANILISNITMSYCPVSFAQGEIYSVAPATQTATDPAVEIVLKPDSAYPDVLTDAYFGAATVSGTTCINSLSNPLQLTQNMSLLTFYPDTRRIKKGTEDLYLTQGNTYTARYEAITLPGNVPGIRVCIPRDPSFLAVSDLGLLHANIQAGDLYLLEGINTALGTALKFSAPAIVADKTSGLTIDHVTILSAPSFGMDIANCRDVIVQYCSTVPGSASQLVSTGADGVILLGNAGPTVVTNCTFDRTHDDSISLYNRTYRVGEAASNTYVIVDSSLADVHGYMQATGDFSIDVVQAGTQTLIARPLVTGAAAYSSTSSCSGATGPFVKLTLNQSITTACGDWVTANYSRQKGFVVASNIIVDNRAWGVNIQGAGGDSAATSPQGAVSQNVIDGSTFGGICLGAESCRTPGAPTPVYPESDIKFSHQVAIDHNLIQNVGWSWRKRLDGCAGIEEAFAGAIAVSSGHQGSTWPGSSGHTDISITNNIVRNCGLAGVFVASAAGSTSTSPVAVQNNQVVDAQLLTNSSLGSIIGVAQPFDAAMVFQNITNLSVTGNLVEATSSHPGIYIDTASVSSSTSTPNSFCYSTGFEAYEFEGATGPCLSPSVSTAYPCFARLSTYSTYPSVGTWTALLSGLTFQVSAWVLYSLPYSYYTGYQGMATNFNTGEFIIQGVASPQAVDVWVAFSNYSSGMALQIEYAAAGSGSWTSAGSVAASSASFAGLAVGTFVPFSFALALSGSYDIRMRLSSSSADYVAVDNLLIHY